MSAPPDDRQHPAGHYENFPVASWLCPPRLRRPIAAIYWFARTADDIADEGSATVEQRLADLDTYRNNLSACLSSNTLEGPWAGVFAALHQAVLEFGLPQAPLQELLDAFRQDVVKTAAGAGYTDRVELLDYCRRSANPVGRLLLHLYGVSDGASLARSDAICTALQLINFWQDLSVDIPQGRYYLPADDCRRHGIDAAAPETWRDHPGAPALVRELCAWARELMLSGAPLVHRVPGRAGWELRLVVQGGLRILDKIGAGGFDSMQRRPRLRPLDAPVMLARAARM